MTALIKVILLLILMGSMVTLADNQTANRATCMYMTRREKNEIHTRKYRLAKTC